MKKYWTMEDAVETVRDIYASFLHVPEFGTVLVEEMGCLCSCCMQVLPAEKEDELLSGSNDFIKEHLMLPYISTSHLIGEKRKHEMLIFSYSGHFKKIITK